MSRVCLVLGPLLKTPGLDWGSDVVVVTSGTSFKMWAQLALGLGGSRCGPGLFWALTCLCR